MKKRRAQSFLTITWGIFFILILAIICIWIYNNLFGKETKQVINWLAQAILPYIMFIVTSQFSDKSDEIEIDKIKFQIAMGISIIYMLFILFTCISLSKEEFFTHQPLQVFDKQTIIYTFFQSVLAIAFGIFFSTKAQKKTRGIKS